MHSFHDILTFSIANHLRGPINVACSFSTLSYLLHQLTFKNSVYLLVVLAWHMTNLMTNTKHMSQGHQGEHLFQGHQTRVSRSSRWEFISRSSNL